MRRHFREFACAMGATRRLDRDLHYARWTIFCVRWFFGWVPELIDRSDQKENCSRNNQKVYNQGNEVTVVPRDCSGFRRVSGCVEYSRRTVSGHA